jgi:hypothetical protein
VDFMVRDETSDYTNVVARYRQDAIQRILRL